MCDSFKLSNAWMSASSAPKVVVVRYATAAKFTIVGSVQFAADLPAPVGYLKTPKCPIPLGPGRNCSETRLLAFSSGSRG